MVKAGSNIVCTGGPLLIRSWMQQLARLRLDHSIEVIWVTSGAIASAVDRTRFAKVKRDLSDKQALSAIGQPMVMDLYNLSLQAVGFLGGQVLLTADDLADRKRRGNFRSTMVRLLEWGAVPILNENDAVANEEIRFGDNDSLSAKVARVMDADRLVILTDVEGLYDSDPRKNPGARLVPALAQVSAKLLSATQPVGGTQRGTGGMYSKLLAAREAGKSGIPSYLVKGDTPGVLEALAAEKPIGTRIGGRG